MPARVRPRTRRRKAARVAQGDLDTAVAMVRAVLDGDAARLAAADPLVLLLAQIAGTGLRMGAAYAAALTPAQFDAIATRQAEAVSATWAQGANDRLSQVMLDRVAQRLARSGCGREVISRGA
jgi:hypothetical protein